MPGRERRRQLERERHQRQVARRIHRDARRRTIQAVVTSVIAVLVIVGGVSVLAFKLSEDSRGKKPEAVPSTSNPGDCAYEKAQAGKTAGHVGTPPPQPNRHTQSATVRTNRGTLKLELYGEKAPCTVNSFTYLAENGYFDHTKCHRLVPKGIHVLQCGDPTGTGQGGPGYQFGTENAKGAKYTAGTVAMANSGTPNSNGSQFFIVYKDAPKLPPKYTVFGKVTQGLDIVQKVAKSGVTKVDPTVGGGPPKKPVKIEQVHIGGAAG
ncbi:MAG: peptidylprolyl isomerase [Streptosporangiales bacterium]